MGEKLLEMRHVTKRFGKLIANRNVDLDLERGEVHALLGENGAGKTTLMNCLYGIYAPEEGEILLNGEPLKLSGPKDAIAHNIGMVHQHFMLVPPLTVLQNIVLGQECKITPMDLSKARTKVEDLCERYHLQLDLDEKVADLSVGAQQRVELIKALYRGADILILDEPTAVLTPPEVEGLFDILHQFVAQGKSIIIISHKLWEVKRISDRVTVLRSGEAVSTVFTKDVEQEDLAAMMVGKRVTLEYDKAPVTSQKDILELKDVSAKSGQNASSLKNVSLHIREGEVLGVAGVDGNGQLELSEVIMGLRPIQSGSVRYRGEDITQVSTRRRIESGFAHIPEERMTQGLVMNFTLSENMILNCYDKPPFTVHHLFDSKKMKANGEKLVEDYDVRPRTPEALARSLSGGNQQKVIIAREFSQDPQLVVAVQPTRGLDIGASDFVHQKLLGQKAKGAGVLLISADLDEVLAVSDRVIVINEGEIMGEFVPGEIDYAEIGLMMGGTRRTVKKEGELA
ncbi:ABC transporter ATP-binding protein [Pseudoflavonifractor sp. MSJ-37]|uniref:ABC transporter ATP-binding protein n=1 Tax=Pseudoflavonifractor sp. MSJ-37 TaxID=2841531 RepID=UPI001C111E40|nr:ABC transporter ATP-binding protein [Pseudoflavonifractor sp. MSJ-37]MBU5435266.1 ABC transporter ATP-binding protein [Pseudoflavonifractor sp. MSJ-37]